MYYIFLLEIPPMSEIGNHHNIFSWAALNIWLSLQSKHCIRIRIQSGSKPHYTFFYHVSSFFKTNCCKIWNFFFSLRVCKTSQLSCFDCSYYFLIFPRSSQHFHIWILIIKRYEFNRARKWVQRIYCVIIIIWKS